MELNFGIISDGAAEAKIPTSGPFRLAILGDFSGGANRGRLEVGKALAKRKPLRVDVDNIDQVMARLKITVSLPMTGEGAVEFPVASIDDFHPDQLYEKVELFSAMSELRQRVASKSGFASAQKEMVAWRAEPAPPPLRGLKRPRGATVPKGGKLSDFANLLGQPSAAPESSSIDIDDLLKAVVRPYIVRAKDPAQAVLLKSIDTALASTMRKVLHHPDFQILESLWRSVDLLTRRLETSTQLQIVLYDVSAEEFAADLSSQDELEETGLYKLLVEQPSVDANQGALSALVGTYVFDHTPPQAELLGRVAKIAAQCNAPFISAINPEFLKTKPEDIHPLIKEAWDGLAGLDEAKHIALATPRFLLRQPYGERTDPIDSFDDFEEFTPQAGLKGFLWGNPAIAAGLLLAQTFAKQGAKMNLGSIMSLGEIPYYFYVDEDGDQTALPCTELLMSERVAALVRGQGFLPLLSIKGRPEIRLGGFSSIAGQAITGRWPDPVGNVIKEEEPAEAEEAAEGEGGEEGAEASADDSSGETSGGDDDLDSLMASLDDTPAETTDETPSDDAPAEESGEGEMDPELAALLKGL
jgi:type VI secretion system ImpB/VipA family protein